MAKDNINVRVTLNGGEIVVRDDDMNRFELTIPSGIECRVQGSLHKEVTRDDLKNAVMSGVSELIDRLTSTPKPKMYAPQITMPSPAARPVQPVQQPAVATVSQCPPSITPADLNAAFSGAVKHMEAYVASGVKAAIFDVLKEMGVSLDEIKSCNEMKKGFEAQKEAEAAPSDKGKKSK